MSYLKESHKILLNIIKAGSFVNLELNHIDQKDRAIVTKIVYGSLNKYYEINYIIDSLSDKSPKISIRIVLLQAIYAIKYLNVPNYAIVNESVKLVEDLKKKQLKGYVNAILNKVARGEYTLPNDNLEVKYNLPEWLIKLVKADYPNDYDKILTAKGRTEEHVRLSKSFSNNDFEKQISDFETTKTGYFVQVNEKIKEMFNKGLLTFQSLTSTLVVEMLGNVNGMACLDLCAAPGGKSVYLAEKGAIVTAAELYPHRIKLIEAYKNRMKVGLTTVQNDALVYNKEWESLFDIVLLDAPCSGLGVISKRPDIVLKKQENDIKRLAVLQLKMIENAAKYVKSGGTLAYSTCTITKEENINIINTFLQNNKNFTLQGNPVQHLPNDLGMDGFFICRLKRED